MVSNAITLIRAFLTLPLFFILAYGNGEYRWVALTLFLGAGLMDIADGVAARRLNETSQFGAMIDLIADRLLTFFALFGLVAAGDVKGAALVAAAILIVRCTIVASLNEALPGRLIVRGTALEKIKIALSFLGIGLLIAPPMRLGQHAFAEATLCIAAIVTSLTLVNYWRHGMRAFADLNVGR